MRLPPGQSSSASCDALAVERLDRDLLAHDIPRPAPTLGFLLCGGRPADFDVAARMDELSRRGWVSKDPERHEWSLTAAGRDVLRSLGWEFVVEDVLRITGRGEYAVGQIRDGAIFAEDWFIVAEDRRLGRVLAIEMVDRPTRPELVALRTDVTLRAGDVLHAHEPLAADA